MTSRALFISIPYTYISDEIFSLADDGLGINMVIDTTSLDTSLLIKFVQKLRFRFIITLTETVLEDEHFHRILPTLYLLYSLSSCIRKSGNQIPVFSGPTISNQTGVKLMTDYFSGQGEQNMELVFFELGKKPRFKNNLVLCSTEVVEDFEKTYFEKFDGWSPLLVIVTPADLHIVNKRKQFLAVVQNNDYLKIFFEICKWRQDTIWLKHQSVLWKARAELYFSFISISKKVGETQYGDILQWYHKEYEVLPRWYKRFGHVLKILMGKRSLK